jgi:hypothetical protein
MVAACCGNLNENFCLYYIGKMANHMIGFAHMLTFHVNFRTFYGSFSRNI